MDDGLFQQYSAEGRDLIRKAYDLAEKALAGEVRSNGEPFFGHPLAVAKIVSDEIGLPPECVAAVFLHEAVRKGSADVDIRSLKLDESVYTMVDGLNKIATIKPKDTRLEAENYKKLIIQYSADPRVTVLKLADRLEVMRSLAIFPKSDRERKVLETLMLYIPLAHQLGLYNMKREMEDIYLSYAEPEQYRLITNKLKATQKDREKLMAEFIEPLKKKLSDAGITYKLKIRTKAAYSIWAKMVKQNVPFEGVFDVFAIRFIIDCPEDDLKLERELCWKVFSFAEEYEQDTKRLRDWVTNPKTNGYESLHITVKNRDGAYVEVQIRTRRMDDIAENGFASHWSYKGIKREETMDKWLTSVRYALEHPDTDSPEDLPQPPSKEIFVFTPTGELRILPAGASVLDFAFSIHTNIGQRCVGGKVGGKPVPIKEKLSTGDVVEILTAKNQRPAPDWVNYVVTTKARQKIKQALSEGEQKLASAGRELLERRLKNWKLEFPDEMLTEMMKKRKMTSVNAFFAAVGEGDIDVNEGRHRRQRDQGVHPDRRTAPSGGPGGRPGAGSAEIPPGGRHLQGRHPGAERQGPEGPGLPHGPLLQPGLRRRRLRLRHAGERHQDPPHHLPERRPSHRNVSLPHPESPLGRLSLQRLLPGLPEDYHGPGKRSAEQDYGSGRHLQGLHPHVQRAGEPAAGYL